MFIKDDGTITITAVLTTRGRQLLAKGQNQFNITKFALADTEVNYDLWNENHNLGSAYYGEKIQNMPVLQPTPNGIQLMNYKLVTMPEGTLRLYSINTPGIASNNIITITFANRERQYEYNIKPETETMNQMYTFTLSNLSTISSIIGYDQSGTQFGVNIEKNDSVSFIGKSFTFRTKSYNNLDGDNIDDTKIVVTGNTTGATAAYTVNYRVVPSIVDPGTPSVL